MPAYAHSIEEIRDMLAANAYGVAMQYAPWVNGAYIDGGDYWTLNPGRADKSVGSFVVHTTGPKAGRWFDFATGGPGGDMIDLIQLSLNCTLPDALREARRFLGLASDDPAAKRRREDELQRQRARRAEAQRKERASKAKRRKQAHAMWLAAQERIKGTPVHHYLQQRRGVDLARMGRQPRAIRYAPECFWQETDRETGEHQSARLPAMVCLIHNRSDVVGVHRTYLALDRDGLWNKAPVTKAKKVLGDYPGGWINIWSGAGARGGKAPSLMKARGPQCVHITEGIEDALTGALLLPSARWIAGVSLGNLARLNLPDNVAEVVLVADQDDDPEAQKALRRAIAAHQNAGRKVRLWQSRNGAKDLNAAHLAKAGI